MLLSYSPTEFGRYTVSRDNEPIAEVRVRPTPERGVTELREMVPEETRAIKAFMAWERSRGKKA